MQKLLITLLVLITIALISFGIFAASPEQNVVEPTLSFNTAEELFPLLVSANSYDWYGVVEGLKPNDSDYLVVYHCNDSYCGAGKKREITVIHVPTTSLIVQVEVEHLWKISLFTIHEEANQITVYGCSSGNRTGTCYTGGSVTWDMESKQLIDYQSVVDRWPQKSDN